MKTVKLVLKIILAFTLPLQAMALGSAGRKEMSIDAQLEFQSLKTKRDQLKKDLAVSLLTIKGLEEIADPTLLGFYRENSFEVVIGTAATGLVASVIARIFSDGAMVKTGMTFLISVTALSAVGLANQWTGYARMLEHLRDLSVEQQKQEYVVNTQKIITLTQEIDALDKQIESIEN
jgi:hypothetical protein